MEFACNEALETTHQRQISQERTKTRECGQTILTNTTGVSPCSSTSIFEVGGVYSRADERAIDCREGKRDENSGLFACRSCKLKGNPRPHRSFSLITVHSCNAIRGGAD